MSPQALASRPLAPGDPTFLQGALEDAVGSIQETFSVQFGLELEPVGPSGKPDPRNAKFGSTIALTSDQEKIQIGCISSTETSEELTRILFALENTEIPTLEDIGDAMREIPNVAAGVWKSKRQRFEETYQLGLPLFIRGSSWIQFYPRGVTALAQTLQTNSDISLQVIISWQPQPSFEGIVSMPVQAQETPPPGTSHFTVEVLQEAVEAVVRTCRVQMDLELEVDADPSDPRETAVQYGSSVALTAVAGSWQLAVMCNREGGLELTRSLFCMEADETPDLDDMADALGEIANVAAGVMKSSRTAAGEKIQLGLPLFMEGESCFEFFADGVQGMAQTVRGPAGLEAHVILVWQEG